MATIDIDEKIIEKLKVTVDIYEAYLDLYTRVIDKDDENAAYDAPVERNYQVIQRILQVLPHTRTELTVVGPELLLLQQHVIETASVYICKLFLDTFAYNIYRMPYFDADELPRRFEFNSNADESLKRNLMVLLDIAKEWRWYMSEVLKVVYSENIRYRAFKYAYRVSLAVTDFTRQCLEAVKDRGLDEKLADQFIRLVEICITHFNYEFHEITPVEGAQLYSTCCMKCLKTSKTS